MDGKRDLESLIRERLLSDKRTHEEIAQDVGCKRAFVTAVRSGSRKSGSFQLAFCRSLGIDPLQGHVVTIRGRVIGGARKAMRSNAVPFFAEEVGPSVDVPAEIDLQLAEAEAILLARQGKGEQRLRLAIKLSDLADSEKQAMEAILDKNYARAVERVSQVMQMRSRATKKALDA